MTLTLTHRHCLFSLYICVPYLVAIKGISFAPYLTLQYAIIVLVLYLIC